MQGPAPLSGSDALFLDFDGTLVELADHPELVRAGAGLPALLAGLGVLLDGAIALVSGRRIGELDRMLAPFRSVAAGLHGLEWRLAPDGEVERAAGTDPLALTALLREASAGLPPGVWLENKQVCAAIHFRAAPHAIGSCRVVAEKLAARLGFEVLSGKMVFEIRPPGYHKGRAVERLMRLERFAGRRPIFVGDDVTDEDAFAAAHALGGLGVKVGAGATIAGHRLLSVTEVEAWLTRAGTDRR